MFDVRTNFFENKLLFLARGKIEESECRLMCDALLKNARKLQPGFVLICDIHDLAPLPEGGRLELQKTMQALLDSGMGAEIRIISDKSVITANQFQRASRSVGYTATEVRSVQEAERLVDQLRG
ncbi:MAG: hypothetical protein RML93_02140 [Anaerolineales bacterium]|nr:hypothetical protein [Anaerolineales bacterium]MDW8446074.1 hypothetical protein [Anaerolineales bacterium]